MKTLKKILSLVLVVAMLASMMIVGAAAAEETTKYEEAVAVVTGVGIIEGDENGMNYQGNVTREQAAKIIAYLLLGKDVAETLSTSKAPFADVAASRWSAGYIAYLKGQGIISGVSDTEFDPTANVTGVAFAKMLLTAVGYGKAGEFEGADWDINTITFANQAGIYKGTLADDVAAAATREEAMLYAFNLLTKVPVVKYNKTFESYYVGNSALDTVDGPFDSTDPEANNNPYAYTLGYTKYELVQDSDGTRDAFGRPAASWVADGAVIAYTVSTQAPDYTLTGGINSDILYNTLGKSVADNLNRNVVGGEYNFYVYTNGKEAEAVDTPLNAPLKAGHTGTNNLITGAGANIELYVGYEDGKYSVDAIVWYEFIGQVKTVKTATNELVVDQLLSGADITVSGEYFDISGYEKGDYVLYTLADGVLMSIEKAEPVVGTYTGYTTFLGMHTAQIDGVSASASRYATGTVAAGPAPAGALVIGTTYNFYKDSQGNLLAAAPYEGSEIASVANYLYVVDSVAELKDGDLGKVKESSVTVQVAYVDGGMEILNMAIKTNAQGKEYVTRNGAPVVITDLAEPGKTANNVIAKGWYVFDTSAEGDLILKSSLTSNDYANVVNGVTTEIGKASLGEGIAYTANSKTVLTVLNPVTKLVNTYTGIANFETIDSAKNNVLVTFAKDSKVAKTVTIIDSAYEGDTVQLLGYCAYSMGTTEVGESFMFYVNGTPTIIVNDGTNFQVIPPSGGEVYALSETNGVYTVTNAKNFALDGDEGFVNANWWSDPDNYVYEMYFISDPNTNALLYKETAVVGAIDDNYFTSVAVTADDIEAGSSVLTEVTDAETYYFDANTKIVDTTFGGNGTLDEGDVFLAYVDKSTNGAYDGELYCTHVWIVG